MCIILTTQIYVYTRYLPRVNFVLCYVVFVVCSVAIAKECKHCSAIISASAVIEGSDCCKAIASNAFSSISKFSGFNIHVIHVTTHVQMFLFCTYL